MEKSQVDWERADRKIFRNDIEKSTEPFKQSGQADGVAFKSIEAQQEI